MAERETDFNAYDFTAVEAKWQKYWEENKTFRVVEDPAVPVEKRFYCLDMFPYPSGAGLHVGHPEGYTATDIVCRYKRMRGYNVLHPMGWDAFGLPAENYAIKTGTHPGICTENNINNFRRQIKALGFSYDWDREISTCDPDYFRWTQWIFLQLFKAGLAYQANVPINFCPSCKTGLSNEEVKDGACDRCGTDVVRKDMNQWMLRITAYGDRLLSDLDLLNWPESIKLMQRNWIGRSVGAEVDFKLQSSDEKIRVFTTRPDTLFGATYMVLAPEHPLVGQITTDQQREAVDSYVKAAHNKSDLERTDLAKEKSGVFTGAYAVNPVNGEEIPVWISDYILISYGTGAIMAVPAHDERDFAFAKKFGLDIVQVVSRDGEPAVELKEAFVEEGVAVNSGQFNGKKTADVKQEITAWLTEIGAGEEAVHYKLRDWVFSRQRYWGEPIPLVHCEQCGTVAVPEEELPLTLPEVESYTPTGTGESPLAAIDEWVNTECPQCGKPAKRETDTMPQWAGSCWYYIRYLDPQNDKQFASEEALNYWLPVDLYIGGAEHAVLHLLYSRFWHKFLYDQKLLPGAEPFVRLVNQGLILGEDGQKMSKSLGNVVNPDDVIAASGADAMRCYEMFMGPLETSKPWNTRGILGIRRFLDKVWRALQKEIVSEQPGAVSSGLEHAYHKAVKKVTDDLDNMAFNTALSALMVLVNEINKVDKLPRQVAEGLVLMTAPFAPHLGEELWEQLGHSDSVAYAAWPEFDEEKTKESSVEVVFQVNGKVRDKQVVSADISKADLEKAALESDKIVSYTAGKSVVKVIVVPGKLVNIVVK